MACCPLCFYDHPFLHQHLRFFHKVVNTEEMGIILQWASRMVDLMCITCPKCHKKTNQPQHHINSEHHKLSPSEAQSIIDKEKFKVIVEKLRSLRAKRPQPAMVTKWDLDLQASRDEVHAVGTEDLSDLETQASKEEELDIKVEHPWDLETRVSKEKEPDIKVERHWDLVTQASEETGLDIKVERPWDLETRASKEKGLDIKVEESWELETHASKEEESDSNVEESWELESQASKEEEPDGNVEESWDLETQASTEEVPANEMDLVAQASDEQKPFIKKDGHKGAETQTSREGMAAIITEDPMDREIQASEEELSVNTDEPDESESSSMPFRLKGTTCCPLCFDHYVDLSHHLWVTHKILNTAERGLILQWASKRVGLENIPCPKCSKKTMHPEHHIQLEHKEISASETLSLLEREKFKRIVQQLGHLRATRPKPPMVTKWDLDSQASGGELADTTQPLRFEGLIGCPLCYGHYSALSQHLRVTHKIYNTEERSLILKLATRRVNLQSVACPICSEQHSCIEQHLKAKHKDLTKSEVSSLLEWEKFKVIMGRLRSLRATRPMPAMVTQWDLLGYEDEAARWGRNQTPIDDQRELCDNELCRRQIKKYQETIASLTEQVAQLTSTLQEVAIQLLEGTSEASTASVPTSIRSLLAGLEGVEVKDTGLWASPAEAGTSTCWLEEGEQRNELGVGPATAADNGSAEQATEHRTSSYTADCEGGQVPVSEQQPESPASSRKRPSESESSERVQTKKRRRVDDGTLIEEPDDNRMQRQFY